MGRYWYGEEGGGAARAGWSREKQVRDLGPPANRLVRFSSRKRARGIRVYRSCAMDQEQQQRQQAAQWRPPRRGARAPRVLVPAAFDFSTPEPLGDEVPLRKRCLHWQATKRGKYHARPAYMHLHRCRYAHALLLLHSPTSNSKCTLDARPPRTAAHCRAPPPPPAAASTVCSCCPSPSPMAASAACRSAPCTAAAALSWSRRNAAILSRRSGSDSAACGDGCGERVSASGDDCDELKCFARPCGPTGSS